MVNESYSDKGKRKLFKNPDEAKICGVCAGVAEYFGFEVWVVRIIAVSTCLLGFFNGTVIIAYIVLSFVLDPKPGSQSTKGCFGLNVGSRRSNKSFNGEDSRPYRSSVKEVWKAGTSGKETFDRVDEKFSQLERKIQKLESFVTSSQFELEKEFHKMAD